MSIIAADLSRRVGQSWESHLAVRAHFSFNVFLAILSDLSLKNAFLSLLSTLPWNLNMERPAPGGEAGRPGSRGHVFPWIVWR